MVDPAWFGPRLKELREAKGLTQPELAERAGMNRFGIAKLEQGVSRPHWDTVVALCQALEVDCNAFMQEPSTRKPAGPGRPPKPAEPAPVATKKPRGRPRKTAAEPAPVADKKPRRKKGGE
jgi:transcriptional regulator with XRE-family HTH domain